MARAPIRIVGAEKISPVIGGIVEEVDECYTDNRYEDSQFVNRNSLFC